MCMGKITSVGIQFDGQLGPPQFLKKNLRPGYPQVVLPRVTIDYNIINVVMTAI